jgi:hypothetical protein
MGLGFGVVVSTILGLFILLMTVANILGPHGLGVIRPLGANMTSPPVSDTPLPPERLAELLAAEAARYQRKGFLVLDRGGTSMQLRRPKVFSLFWAFLWFLVFGVGIVVYLIWYAAKRDTLVLLTVDERGSITTRRA